MKCVVAQVRSIQSVDVRYICRKHKCRWHTLNARMCQKQRWKRKNFSVCTCICKRWKGGWRASSKCRITSVWRESRIHIEHSICVIYRTIHCNPIPCNSCYSYILSLSLSSALANRFCFFALHRSACIALNPNFITFEKDTHCSNSNSNSNATKKDMQ